MRPWLRWIHYVIDPVSYAYEVRSLATLRESLN